jgi:hypothetical protein
MDADQAGIPATFSSFAACCNLPDSSAPNLVSTLITAGITSHATQFSQERKKLRISLMA